jgi:response regulator RpfG family c-di-GMP phosphodiesterase
VGHADRDRVNARDALSSERILIGRKHILAMNGASEFLDLIRLLLEQENYNVTTTNFVLRTDAMIAALKPDLVIVDIVVGHQMGWDLLESLHREILTRAIPLLLTSTDPRMLARAQADEQRYGWHRVIAKPMDIDELLGTVREIIGAP